MFVGIGGNPNDASYLSVVTAGAPGAQGRVGTITAAPTGYEFVAADGTVTGDTGSPTTAVAQTGCVTRYPPCVTRRNRAPSLCPNPTLAPNLTLAANPTLASLPQP